MRHKLRTTLLIVTSLVIGGAGGGYLVYSLQPPKETSTSSQDTATTQQRASARPIDKVSGFNMTPPDMADELQALPSSEDFGWRYANYLIMMRNNEIAMARQAKDKATQPEIKQLAQEQIDLNEELVSGLYRLMRAAGMSH